MIVFGQTPPVPKRCLTCKNPRETRWAWDGTQYVCLICTQPNIMVLRCGPGPEGATCGKCLHRVLMGGHARSYPKCELRNDVTNGSKTDQKASWKACAKFEPEQEGTR